MKIFLSILLFITLTAFVNSCSKSGKFKEGTIELNFSDCKNGTIDGDDLKICFNAVVSDSRCPANAMCVWQGAATASFSLTKNGHSHNFNLSTITMPPNYTKDTTIAGYKIEFINLSPYPGTVADPIPDSQRKAELKITKQ